MHNGVEVIAAATDDGRVFLLESASLGGADHSQPLFSTPVADRPAAPDGLATFELEGTRWVLVPSSRALVGFRVVTDGPRLSLKASMVFESTSLTHSTDRRE
jgi:hypothetical protein